MIEEFNDTAVNVHPFKSFGKIPRLDKDIVITEKLDGTNAQIFIDDNNEMYTGSRNRWVKIGDDNFGFAAWAEANKQELLKLGKGHHFGEWWGRGIQRGYNMQERVFSLFNVHKWSKPYEAMKLGYGHDVPFPSCCSVVPVLYVGAFDTKVINEVMNKLKKSGSIAAPGFMDPEGIIIYHTAANHLYKKTFDDSHKGV